MKRSEDGGYQSDNCGDLLNSATLFAKWPKLEPRTRSNEADFQATSWKSVGETSWMDIGFQRAHHLTGSDPKGPMAARLDYEMDVVRREQRSKIALEAYDPGFPDLQAVRTTGPGMDKPAFVNRRIFWPLRSGEGPIETLIICGNGKFDPPRWVAKCTQRFYLPRLDAEVRVAYADKYLRDWKEIESRVSELLNSFTQTCDRNGGDRK